MVQVSPRSAVHSALGTLGSSRRSRTTRRVQLRPVGPLGDRPGRKWIKALPWSTDPKKDPTGCVIWSDPVGPSDVRSKEKTDFQRLGGPDQSVPKEDE